LIDILPEGAGEICPVIEEPIVIDAPRVIDVALKDKVTA
jgi:hypothetical protein